MALATPASCSRSLPRPLRRAIDRTLAKAVAYSAHRTPGAGAVLAQYRDAFPDVASALDDLSVAQSANGGVAGADAAHMFAFAMPTPPSKASRYA